MLSCCGCVLLSQMSKRQKRHWGSKERVAESRLLVVLYKQGNRSAAVNDLLKYLPFGQFCPDLECL